MTKTKDIFTIFDEEVDRHNEEINSYRRLAPKIMPVMKILSKEIKNIYLGLTYCTLTFKGDKLPDRIYHILDENNLTGVPVCHSYSGLGYGYRGEEHPQITVSDKID